LNYGFVDTFNTSVRCKSCKLLNSFSFDSKQNKCIRCNSRLKEESIKLTMTYKENLFNQSKNQTYGSEWNNNDNKH
jgi:hypothetical protein